MSLKRKRDMEQMLQSRQIKFVVGPEKVEYSVHESSLIALSKKLKSNFANLANDASIYWEDVEPDTFVNLMEYAYYKDYTVPAVTKVSKNAPAANDHRAKDDNVKVESDNDGDSDERDGEDDSDESDGEDEPVECLQEYLEFSSHKGAQYKYAYENFADNPEKETGSRNETNTTLINAPSSVQDSWLMDIKQNGHTGYLPVLMTHIRLCLLAQKHCMNELSGLCMNRLRQSLLHCPGTTDLFMALKSIIKTVYQETRPNNELRKLLVQFCVTDMGWMMQVDFHDLIRQTPEFSADLLTGIPLAYWEELREGVEKMQH